MADPSPSSTTGPSLRVGVFGAGAIGSYLGICLSSAGTPVVMVARRGLVEVRAELRAVSVGGVEKRPGDDFVVTEDVGALDDVDVCLLTVKSSDTASVVGALSRAVPSDAVVVSFQNGVHNAERLRAQLSHRVLAGMVGFNVLREPPASFLQLARGALVIERVEGAGQASIDQLVRAFADADQELDVSASIADVLAGKLLVNLNNGVGAATGLTISESLRSRDARWCFAACIREGVAVMKAAGIRPAKVVALGPAALAKMLTMPDFIVLAAARRMIDIDDRAVTSTLLDIKRGRPTEIGDLNGEIVRIAKSAGVPAPVNALVTDIVRGLERSGPPPSFIRATELRRRLEEVRA